MNQKNLILPEKIVIDLMALTSRLGEIAVDYNNKIGGEETEHLVRLYTKVIHKLMDLEYQDLNNKSGYSFEELLKSAGIEPSQGDENGSN
tara:strand:+ start:1351 stop:1620 length:270 start_codon:yes stop_codon:yes gene_type:complete